MDLKEAVRIAADLEEVRREVGAPMLNEYEALLTLLDFARKAGAYIAGPQATMEDLESGSVELRSAAESRLWLSTTARAAGLLR